jgi:hypothetical protein
VLGKRLIVFNRITSTNDFLKRLARRGAELERWCSLMHNLPGAAGWGVCGSHHREAACGFR